VINFDTKTQIKLFSLFFYYSKGIFIKNSSPKDFLLFNYDSYLLRVLHFGPKLNFIHVLVPEFEKEEEKSLKNRGEKENG
jgi:hypothetical protein